MSKESPGGRDDLIKVSRTGKEREKHAKKEPKGRRETRGLGRKGSVCLVRD